MRQGRKEADRGYVILRGTTSGNWHLFCPGAPEESTEQTLDFSQLRAEEAGIFFHQTPSVIV